jgi:hypothetical protein
VKGLNSKANVSAAVDIVELGVNIDETKQKKKKKKTNTYRQQLAYTQMIYAL